MMPLHYVRHVYAASLQTITHEYRNSAQPARHKASTQDMLDSYGDCVRMLSSLFKPEPRPMGIWLRLPARALAHWN